jgi:GNAT superfamily N-acetyltransferase
MERYTTAELTTQTWPDFERLFTRGNGWDFCWCMGSEGMQRASQHGIRTRAEVSGINHRRKKQRLDEGRAHGILVYADGEPIGWCKYGRADDVAGRDWPHSQTDPRPAWRVMCFVVDRKWRRKGVAGVALRAALESIRSKGGGLVEAYPVVSWTAGKDGSAELRYVTGVGPVAPAHGDFNNVSTSGVVSMFEKEGFTPVGVSRNSSQRVRSLGAEGCHVVMRKLVR